MRIVSGKYRGKKLREFNLSTTKPTLDRVKESIFNLIQFEVQDAIVLDLFAGTGALGIESISRGAKRTIFVDNNVQAIKIIKENLKGIEGDYEVVNQDFNSFLISNKLKFDLVLLDPPYASNYGEQAIKKLIENDHIAENGIIIFETSDDRKFDLELDNFKIDKRKYGTVAVYKIQKES